MRSLILLASFFLSFPALANLEPNGGMGDVSKWQKKWSEDFDTCFKKEARTLQSTTPNDQGKYCGTTSTSQANYWLSIFIPLAQKESNFDPNAHGKNGGKVPIGLFQMDSTDMKSHKCEGADPANPQQAICCAIKIADDQAKKFHSISQGGTAGIMSSFWQPMKDGMGGDGRGGKSNINNSKNHSDIMASSKQLCSTNFASVGGAANPDSGQGGGDYSNTYAGGPYSYSYLSVPPTRRRTTH